MAINTDLLEFLRTGDLAIKGEFLWGSNYTFLAEVSREGEMLQAVYKPSKGERPLWDFPSATLARREVAAYRVSQALEWGLVPPTVFRLKGPLGAGSLQLFVEHDPEYHYFNFTPEDIQRLRPVVLFDILINNADRKGSHILRDDAGALWLIDHGVCFHVEDKLRTVIWDFVGEAIPEELCRDLTRLAELLRPVDGGQSPLAVELLEYLSRGEIRALAARANQLVTTGVFPAPDPYRRPFPWPQI